MKEIDNTRENKRETKRKKGRSWLSRLNSWLHLWLGIGSGIIVFIVAITGCMFVFCDDIIDGIGGSALRVPEVKEVRLTPEELVTAFKKENPHLHPFYFVTYKDPQRTFRVGAEDKNDVFSFTWVDPYTGKSLKTTTAYYFFYVVAHIHSGHIPFGEVGGLIVEIATWIFLIELITGLILWWPVKWTKATREQSFKIKFKASWKRVNYDLHNVPGFYSLVPALMLTVTGLIIANKPLNRATHNLLDGKAQPYAAIRKMGPAYDSTRAYLPMNTVLDQLLREPGVTQVRMSLPPERQTVQLVLAGSDIGLKGIDGRILVADRYTGNEIKMAPALLRGISIEGWNMNLHIGFWAGWFGKIFTFIIGLICAALPITGFLIWWGRRKKKKPVRRVARPTVQPVAASV
ncbi:MAG: PepSY-associated TM helix domain-containing protein [Candidatus Pseudobacter hemicellulosilyticus]|uniref:PepSY-associated TM helix domain-containing protein n=1 Tax=Candidatus Pseudobacter hemicellulosilyticus TaxID=3121375 RepID=A0AAJ5WSK1_9BACT|nr:MAG: PepSY-associated TM helix domain-containing protein [Pseudobacter sp.]